MEMATAKPVVYCEHAKWEWRLHTWGKYDIYPIEHT